MRRPLEGGQLVPPHIGIGTGGRGRGHGIAPHLVPSGGDRRNFGLENGVEVIGNQGALCGQMLQERNSVGKAHALRQQIQPVRLVRQSVGLMVIGHLQMVFHPAQQGVGRPQLVGDRLVQIVAAAQQIQGRQQRLTAQGDVAAAMNQLKGLNDEFDVANAPHPQFQILGMTFAGQILGDHPFQIAQGVQHREIHIAAINERHQDVVQSADIAVGAGDGAGLDQGVTLPGAAMGLVIIFQRIEALRQLSGSSERPQAHIHPIDESPIGDGGQGGIHHPPQFDEKLAVIDLTRSALGLTVFRIGKDQIDVRRKIQFPPAQLAHRQHDHLLGLAGLPADGGAPQGAQPLVGPAIGGSDQGVGHIRGVGQGFFQPGQAGQIAHGDADQLTMAQPAQSLTEIGFVLDGQKQSAVDVQTGPIQGHQARFVQQGRVAGHPIGHIVRVATGN